MGAKSKIEWTDATWNAVVGCTLVSPGCTNCYAMEMAARLGKMLPPQRRGDAVLPNHYADLTKTVKGRPAWTGRVSIAPDHILTAPLRRRKPTTYFVNSMGDLFHESVPDEWIDRVFAVMARAPQHTFQVLTKRSKRMREYFATTNDRNTWRVHLSLTAENVVGRYIRNEQFAWPLPNVWLGVSAERQQEADERIPDLLATPAAVRFVSAEPLLADIDFTAILGSYRTGPEEGDWHFNMRIDALRALSTPAWQGRASRFCPKSDASKYLGRLDWVIVGGESGKGARPMRIEWARSIRDQCKAAGVPFFFKQWGEWLPMSQGGNCGNGQSLSVFDDPRGSFHARAFKVGKHRAGRLLDGVEHNAMPELRT